ncbi:MAG: YciI family protein [Sphingomonadales bacterium]
MIFAVTGILKEGAEARLAALQEAFNEHLTQPFRRILLGGSLRGADGKRTGFIVLIEAGSFAEAEAFLHQSPLFQADLYQRAFVSEFVVEVGTLE